jgi:hypothetical protein
MRFCRAFGNDDPWVLNLLTCEATDLPDIAQWNNLSIFWGHAELFLGKYGDARSNSVEGKQEMGDF